MSSSWISKRKRSTLQAPNLDQVGYLCRRIMQASLRDLQETVPELDVTIGQMGTVVLIACNPGITPTEICKAQGHEKPTITASLDALERKQLISRKTSKFDGRSFSLHLTAKGEAFYSQIIPRVREADKRLTRTLNNSERHQLIKLLMRIYESECVEQEAITGAPMVRLKAVGQADISTGKPKSRNSKAQKKTTSDVLKQLNELERSSAELRKVVQALSSG